MSKFKIIKNQKVEEERLIFEIESLQKYNIISAIIGAGLFFLSIFGVLG